MRASLASVGLLVVGAFGCSSRPDRPPEETQPRESNGAGGAAGVQCRLEPERVTLTMLTTRMGETDNTQYRAAPMLARGPRRPRVFAWLSTGAIAWADAESDGTLVGLRPEPDNTEGFRGAWMEGRFVGSAGTNEVVFGPTETALRATAMAGPRATERWWVSGGTGALTVWSTETTRRGDTRGEVRVQRVDGGGGLVGPSVALVMDDPSGLVDGLRARWDLGRYVVTAMTRNSRVSMSWVLAPDASLLTRSVGHVACPSSGCAQVSIASESGEEGNMLRVSSLTQTEYWNTGSVALDILGLAVSGPRVLVLHSPSNGMSGCAVTLLDPGHKRVLLEQQFDHVVCDASKVVATPRGFALLEEEAGTGVHLRAIECGRH